MSGNQARHERRAAERRDDGTHSHEERRAEERRDLTRSAEEMERQMKALGISTDRRRGGRRGFRS